MRFFAAVLVALAWLGVCHAKLTPDLIKKVPTCDFGAPGDNPNDPTQWVLQPCEETNADAKEAALGKGAEFHGASKMTSAAGYHEVIHGKVGEKCCSVHMTRPAGGKVGGDGKVAFVFQRSCCYDACPDWMKKC